MGFPVLDHLDQDASYQLLVDRLCPDGLACPRCRARDGLDGARRPRQHPVRSLRRAAELPASLPQREQALPGSVRDDLLVGHQRQGRGRRVPEDRPGRLAIHQNRPHELKCSRAASSRRSAHRADRAETFWSISRHRPLSRLPRSGPPRHDRAELAVIGHKDGQPEDVFVRTPGENPGRIPRSLGEDAVGRSGHVADAKAGPIGVAEGFDSDYLRGPIDIHAGAPLRHGPDRRTESEGSVGNRAVGIDGP